MTYRDREIIARWNRGVSPEEIAQELRVTELEVLIVINRERLGAGK